MKRTSPYCQRQSGATLVIALIILLVMSLIGISNMQSSTMQERMAANVRQKTVAFYSAESALKAAEAWFYSTVTKSEDITDFNGTSGLYSSIVRPGGGVAVPLSGVITDVGKPSDWGTTGIVQHDGGNIVDEKLVSQQPRYVIEYLGRTRGTSNKTVSELNSDSKGEGELHPYMFRVTAIGWGKDKNIYTVLEATLRTGSNHYFTY
ncbi:pilus assembly PilX family protein [Teredinibacter purpureus]|uniref:pilus assembly PilX family protein n=1 Tax=Teredinibacter purpureus TaxID=2731756 RepID=UPI0005F89308|nr:PilX N-terminal domain-containing pilus assembly protein [Teredinibacter purpureus]